MDAVNVPEIIREQSPTELAQTHHHLIDTQGAPKGTGGIKITADKSPTGQALLSQCNEIIMREIGEPFYGVRLGDSLRYRDYDLTDDEVFKRVKDSPYYSDAKLEAKKQTCATLKRAFNTDRFDQAFLMRACGIFVQEEIMDKDVAKQAIMNQCGMGENTATAMLEKSVTMAEGKQIA